MAFADCKREINQHEQMPKVLHSMLFADTSRGPEEKQLVLQSATYPGMLEQSFQTRIFIANCYQVARPSYYIMKLLVNDLNANN